MAYDETLAGRIRKILAGNKGFNEKKMFGGLTFMVRGHMCCGVMDDKLVVRIGVDKGRAALRKPHTSRFDFTGKPMNGMVVVRSSGIESDASLRRWVQQAVAFVSALPDKKGTGK